MNKTLATLAAIAALAILPSTARAENGGPVTYTKDVAPILFDNCASCHRPGEIGPMSLMNYQETRPWAKSIKQVVHEGSMPPWHADSTKIHYANDRSLSAEEVETIVAWVDQGAKVGNPEDMPEPPVFNDEWAMGEPDMVFEATREFTVPPNTDYIDYQSIYFAPALDEDLYVQSWEIRPTERGVVHHANLVRAPKELEEVGIGDAVLAGGDYIGSYLPGARPMEYPEGTALRIPKGSVIQIQVHYVGVDEPVTDRMRFGVKLADGRVDKIMRTVGTDDYEIEIAPHGEFEMDTAVTLNYPLTLLSSGAHMHLRGDSYTTKAILPDGSEKLITDVPQYDFNWQSNYQLAEPVSVPAGTKYHVHAEWLNTPENKNVTPEEAAQKVVYGKWTENEMLTTWSHAVLTDEKLGLKVENGRVVGKFDDASDAPHPWILQTLPNTFTKPKTNEQKEVSQGESAGPAAAEAPASEQQ